MGRMWRAVTATVRTTTSANHHPQHPSARAQHYRLLISPFPLLCSSARCQVWASSDQGKSWALVTARAPWLARDTFNAEVTKAGLIVLTGGWSLEGGNTNDVSHTYHSHRSSSISQPQPTAHTARHDFLWL